MRCSEFREFYSEYRDGLITDPVFAGRLERHLALCLRCAGFHTSVDRGVELLRLAGEVEPSAGFRHRLNRRLATVSVQPEPVLPAPAGLAAAMMFVAALGIIVYEGVERGRTAEAQVTAVAAAPSIRRAAHVPTVPPSPPSDTPEPLTELVFPAFGETGVHFSGTSSSPGFEAALTVGFDGSR